MTPEKKLRKIEEIVRETNVKTREDEKTIQSLNKEAIVEILEMPKNMETEGIALFQVHISRSNAFDKINSVIKGKEATEKKEEGIKLDEDYCVLGTNL